MNPDTFTSRYVAFVRRVSGADSLVAATRIPLPDAPVEGDKRSDARSRRESAARRRAGPGNLGRGCGVQVYEGR